MPPKKSVELIVLLVDVNSSANITASSNPEGVTDFDVSAAIADSILCRKIFSESRDLCSVICFGFQSRRPGNGFYTVSDGFEKPTFMTVEKLEEVKPGIASPVTVQNGLEYAIKEIDQYKAENPNSNINSTIFMMSNLDSTPASLLTEESARKLAKSLCDSGIELFVASPDSIVNDEDKKSKLKFMSELISKAKAMWLPFSECKTRFGSFIPKQVGLRGMPFDLKLDENTSIKLQMYGKNSQAKINHSFVFCTEDGKEEMRKHFEHSTRPDITIGIADVDKITDEEFITGKFNKMEEEKRIIDKSDIINAYYYGKTIVPVDDEIKEEFKPERLGKELNLIQFTSRDNILPQYILSTPRYLLPVQDTYGSQVVLQSLVKELLEKNLVLIARYAYNIRAYSRIVCLIPKITKNGLPIFVHYVLPHGDDMRPYEFAYLDTEENKPDTYQSDAMDEFVSALMLEDEELRPKNVSNPKIQHECLFLRSKALEPGEPIQRHAFARAVTAPLRMRDDKGIMEVAEDLAKAFDLQVNEKIRTRDFGNRPLGVDPLSFGELSADKEKEEMKMEH